jgi:superfamily I DNA and/or RNA helicase
MYLDEAGQLSLIDTIAVSQAAKNIILLGDPQQLKQPVQGSHPEGTEISALEHILGEHKTIPVDRGIFLNETWRMHPGICSFISELFYEDRLKARPELSKQRIDGATRFKGAGLWFEPVVHAGNQSSSVEEVKRVAAIITELTAGGLVWINEKNEARPLVLNDIMVIAPYNAQVGALVAGLPPGTHVGTVDKFQGQEAPVVLFSMATSSPDDAPRGMEFLYSLNRLNVAVSRARAVCIIVASPLLFEPDCKNPQQIKLANAFCRYLEMTVKR